MKNMTENIPELPDDNRGKYEWQSKYAIDELTGKDPRKIMRGEATYLFILLCLSFLGVFLNYKGVFLCWFEIPASDSIKIQRLLYCMFAGLLGGVTFSIKIFYRAVARGLWNLDRRYWRFFSPLISLSVTSLVAAFMMEDLMNSHPYWVYAIGYFAGYFSENAVGKMYDIAVVLFSSPPPKDCDTEEIKKVKVDGKD